MKVNFWGTNEAGFRGLEESFDDAGLEAPVDSNGRKAWLTEIEALMAPLISIYTIITLYVMQACSTISSNSF
jgi:hypothetical protein